MTDKQKCGDCSVKVINCELDKKHTTNHLAVISWGEKNDFSYTVKEFLTHADIVMRLEEEINTLQNYLVNHGNEMPPESKGNAYIKLIDLKKILTGDKPEDNIN